MHANNDAMGLLQLCKVAKENNFKFQYAYTTDEESRLEHIFWAPTPCFDLYQKYGDVVVFYTTYKVNAYDMPFGICVGINNHGTLLLNLVVGLWQFFVVNIQIGARISTSYIS